MAPINSLGAAAITRSIRSGNLSAREVMSAMLARIAARQDAVQAWAFVDPAHALEQARLADEWHALGLPLGCLHGVPIGIKDVFDTCDMPSEYGCPLYRGRRPERDAAVVQRLRQAGAIIVGKTTTSELGMYHQSKARNPHDVRRSAGVSSSGSAVAVVDGMVPVAIGTQHTSSTLLPAAFCGAFGLKPSYGTADMSGSNILVPRLAQLGLLARDLDDLELFLDVFDTWHPIATADRPLRAIGVVRGPRWHEVEASVSLAFECWIEALPFAKTDIALPEASEAASDIVMTMLDANLAHRFMSLPDADFQMLCPPLRECITRGRALGATQFFEAERQADDLCRSVGHLFASVDVMVTLAAPTEATLLEQGPGSGSLTMLWSLCGLPTASLPLLRGGAGLPVGVQVIGPRGADRALLACAREIAACS